VLVFPCHHLPSSGLCDLLVIADIAVVPGHHGIVDVPVVVHASEDDVLDVLELVRSLVPAPVEEVDTGGVAAHQPFDQVRDGLVLLPAVVNDQPLFFRLTVG